MDWGWGPKFNDKVFLDGKGARQRRWPFEGKIATMLMLPCGSPRNQKRRRILFESLWREPGPVSILIVDFQPPEMRKNKFLVF